jgi:glutamate--cysteine ligase
VVEAGEYRQLNANVLQIENEYYSSVRPKQPLQGLEKPTVALRKRGVGYVELRSLDNNPFVPLGVAEDQLRFLELLMLHSLMQTERLFTPNERLEIDNNLLLVAHYGRDDQLRLQRGGRTVAMKDWAREILESMEPIAEALESAGKQGYRQALKEQVERANGLREPLSARMLREMNENREDFVAFTLRLSRQHQQWLLRPWAEPQQRRWRQLAEQSWRDHEALERRYQGIAFEQFLADYFAQRAVD